MKVLPKSPVPLNVEAWTISEEVPENVGGVWVAPPAKVAWPQAREPEVE